MSRNWEKGKTKASLLPQICGEAISNPRPGDSLRQLSPLHQACPSKGQTQCRRLPHECSLGKGKTETSLLRKIYGEATSNPWPGDSVRQLSPLHLVTQWDSSHHSLDLQPYKCSSDTSRTTITYDLIATDTFIKCQIIHWSLIFLFLFFSKIIGYIFFGHQTNFPFTPDYPMRTKSLFQAILSVNHFRRWIKLTLNIMH